VNIRAVVCLCCVFMDRCIAIKEKIRLNMDMLGSWFFLFYGGVSILMKGILYYMMLLICNERNHA
jgi:hypothetical protein